MIRIVAQRNEAYLVNATVCFSSSHLEICIYIIYLIYLYLETRKRQRNQGIQDFMVETYYG